MEQGAAENAEPTNLVAPLQFSRVHSALQTAAAYLSTTMKPLAMTADSSGRPGHVGFGTPRGLLRHHMHLHKNGGT
jgi:hypothetical protein